MERIWGRCFMALWFFNKVVWFVLAAMLEGILLPSNMAAKTTFGLYITETHPLKNVAREKWGTH